MVYRPRLHPDTIRGVGTWGHIEAAGAGFAEAPTGATGILFQQDGSGDTWFCLSPITGSNQGFIVPKNNQITQIWFDPECSDGIYIFNEANADFHYQFISAARPI